ncbi:MAG: hypothetical protein FD189_125 [Elusimicrobia bacterium]|nr:MAG: hypothetical protein FD154_277 [Elusimicrobiota bacterium]KAF0158133.1 MAG: hypothetical protein FD189_125 [Elusimicrobiota bacterium]
MEIPSNPVFQIVLSGVLVFLFGEIIQRFLLEPIKDFKKTIGKIDNKLKYYEKIIVTPDPNNDPKVSKVLRELSCDLESSYKQIPGTTSLRLYGILPNQENIFFGILPNQENISKAAKKIIFLSNSVNLETKDKQKIFDRNLAILKEIRKCLNIQSFDYGAPDPPGEIVE